MSARLQHAIDDALRTPARAMIAALAATLAIAGPAMAQDGFRNAIDHDKSRCAPGAGPAVLVTIHGIKDSAGTLRVQSYRGVKEEWLKKGKWLNRIEAPAQEGSMTFCMPVPEPGTYGIAVRHDTNNNGKTEIFKDGGAMSNNPSLNIFNLGKPSYKKTRFDIGPGVEKIMINMRYR